MPCPQAAVSWWNVCVEHEVSLGLSLGHTAPALWLQTAALGGVITPASQLIVWEATEAVFSPHLLGGGEVAARPGTLLGPLHFASVCSAQLRIGPASSTSAPSTSLLEGD